MKRLIYTLTLVATLFVVGCGNDDDNNDNTDAYNRYGYGGYGMGGSALGFYRWEGNVCIDTRNGREVNQRYCNASGGGGFGFGGGCGGFGYGGGYGYGGGCGGSSWDYSFVQGNFGSTGVCSYGYTAIPMLMPTGYGYGSQMTMMCVQSGFMTSLYSYGTPTIPYGYGGYGYQAVGCIPGYSSGCNCNAVGGANFSLGAQFGGAYAGLSAGICF